MLRPATAPAERRADVRLVAIDPAESGERRITTHSFRAIAELLRPGDLVVVNDAATLPASLHGTTARGEAIELRLAGHLEGDTWRAVALGAGDWRTPTEHRPPPPTLAIGDRVAVGPHVVTIEAIDATAPRLLTIRCSWAAVYDRGRPVQYSYLEGDLALWSVQTAFASRPWAVEMPSAGRAFDWATLVAMRRRGIEIAFVTHAAGLSSTGDPLVDGRLPLPERYEVPLRTVEAVARTQARGGAVIAVGTTVVRALETAGRSGRLVAESGVTDLLVGPGVRPRIVDGVLSGLHDPTESHFRLLRAFADASDLLEVQTVAVAEGLRQHEFGDACLLLPRRDRLRAPSAA